MKTLWIRLLFTLAVISLPVAMPGLQAQNLGAVKQRMAQRLPAGRRAEGPRGGGGEQSRFPRGPGGAFWRRESETVSAENADRAEVYGALAQQTGSSADQVGRARAKKIAETSSPGSGCRTRADAGTRSDRSRARCACRRD